MSFKGEIIMYSPSPPLAKAELVQPRRDLLIIFTTPHSPHQI